MKSPPQKSSLRDVAEFAEVSIGTASKVVNSHYVRPELRKRVERAMEELHYVPNQIARSLKSQNTKTVGVIIPNIVSPVYGMLLRGIEELAARTGYSIIFYDTNMSNGSEEQALSLFKEKMVSGVIYSSNSLTPSMEKKLHESGLPVVLTMTKSSDGTLSTITVDNEDAAYQITKYLIVKKHTRILHLAGLQNDFNAGVPRYNGYLRALYEAGIPEDSDLVVFGNYSADRGYRDMQKILKEKPAFTAVFAAADEIAIGAMKAMREHGLRIPEDFVIAGFDGIPIADYVVPSLCTVEQPFYQIGADAIKLLIDSIETERGTTHITLSTRIKNKASITARKQV